MQRAVMTSNDSEHRRQTESAPGKLGGEKRLEDALEIFGLDAAAVVGHLARGVVEAKNRRAKEKTELALADFGAAFAEWREGVRAGWGL